MTPRDTRDDLDDLPDPEKEDAIQRATMTPDLADWVDETGKIEDEMNLPEEAERGEAAIMADPGQGLSESATDMISADHQRLRNMLRSYLAETSPPDMQLFAEQLSTELAVHAQLEEELFYPAVERAAAGDTEDFIDHSLDEHMHMAQLITELHAADPATPRHAKLLRQLADEVLAHMEQEETQLLPLAEETMSGDELVTLGQEMLERKEQIYAGGESLLPAGAGRIAPDEDMTGPTP